MAQPTRRKWSGRMGSALSFLAICGFVTTAAWAKFNPLQANDFVRPAAQKGEAKAKKKATKTPTPAVAETRQIVPAGAKLDAAAMAKIIDQEVNRRLQEEGVKPSAKSDDAEFLRRIYLDLVGVIPPAEKAKEFFDSTDPNRRAKLIDELLSDSRFGKWMSEQWSGLMLPRESNNRALNHGPMQNWLADHFNKGTPLDKVVYDLISSTGTQDENGAVTYFIGNPTVDKMTDNVSKMFLGVQLQCAQCHNHPFTDWKQDEYWGMAQFFMKVRLTANPQQAAKKGVSPGIVENPAIKAKKGNQLPESAKFVPAKFLQGEQPKISTTEPSRPILAKWMTSADNPFFARAMVNRLWYQVFGRGLVNPVDDMHKDNPPSHPELLDALTSQLKAHEFDTKFIIRAICNSEAYQRTSKPTADNASDAELYSHRVVRVLTPEQLFDSLTQVVGQPAKGKDPVAKSLALKKGPGGPREQFLAFFRIDEGADPLEYQHGIPQALRLMNSPLLNSAAGVGKAMMEGKGQGPPAIVEHLYLTALSRKPTEQETERMLRHVREAPDPRTGFGDVMWALLNSSEFALNH